MAANKLPLQGHGHTALAMHAIAYKYSSNKSYHVTFINKLASWYFLYDQQPGRALVSGEKVGCG